MPAQVGTLKRKAITVAQTRTPVIQIAGLSGVERERISEAESIDSSICSRSGMISSRVFGHAAEIGVWRCRKIRPSFQFEDALSVSVKKILLRLIRQAKLFDLLNAFFERKLWEIGPEEHFLLA